ncbi:MULTISPECIES: siderophore-interacting protein [Actinomadura]|uniref:Siderophore-interacting protein n=1 Tax=Actinomadura litoris TaxID=2678616 RepID=A0A7K1L7E2_9ACTN|nr:MULTISPECIES: siderophore-interacting protein [Actinomadura]MBT2209532.1 siderophore-interacting protein [Actinomadura sp. NEAU-AAG7]MUN40223.1 siderophore-interacting protein [Actinomadura litoris]
MTAPADPYGFFELHVLRCAPLGPSMVRVTFGGACLDASASGTDAFVSSGRDQRFKLFLPHPHQDAPVMPADWSPDTWFADWRAMDPAERGIMRSYTVRAQRPGELDVDFVLHLDGASGPAARWAAAARPGDRVVVLGPTGPDNGGYDFRPPPGAPVLIAGDLTALPAVAGNLAWLPAGTPARVWVEAPDAADHQDLPTEADADVAWVSPGGLLEAVRAATVPDGTYAWIAGESATVKALRRHLVNERGMDRRSVTFTGYWRRGATEEDLLAEVVAGGSPATEE